MRVNRNLSTDFFVLSPWMHSLPMPFVLFAGASEFPGLWEAAPGSSRFVAEAQLG